MFHATRWFEEQQFYSPMAITSSGNVFINDFVHFYNGQHLSVRRMLKYFYRVS